MRNSILAFILLCIMCGRVSADFVIGVMPDTQNLAAGDQISFNKMTQFFADMKNNGTNVAFVISVGDMTDNSSSTHWNRVKTAYNILVNAQIPFAPCTGNHDNSSGINSAFPVNDFKNRAWSGYGGSYSNQIENSYWNFTADGMNFRIGVLQDNWTTGANARTWLQNVLSQGPARRAIVAHHSVTPENGGHNYINGIDNVFMGVSGHLCENNGHTNWLSSTVGGYSVNHCRTDYQCQPNEGAIVRYYLFKPAQSKVFAYTYNVTDRVFETTQWAQFSFDYSMTAAPAGTNNSAYVSQTVPSSMVAGQTTNVTVRMKNTGTTTWASADAQKLGSQNVQDNTTWGLNRVNIPSGTTVAPGQEYSFSFNITAPAAAGTYNFQWKMVDDAGSNIGWFGSLTSNKQITVSVPNQAPYFTSNPFSMTNATVGTAYSQSFSAKAVDPEGGAMTFSKVSGPVWLSVTSPGSATGTPGSVDVGTNSFMVKVTDNGGLSATATMTIKVVPAVNPPQTVTFTSIGAEDGYLNESTETSNIGGGFNATGTAGAGLRIGDTTTKQQHKSVVSFDTSSIPDGAVIQAATLKMMRGAISGTVTNLGLIKVDIKGGTGFNNAVALSKEDFQAVADATGVATMSYPSANGTLSTGSLNATGLTKVNKTGKTQLRIYFATDDNNNAKSDYLGFYPAENATAANRPVLEVTYQ